MPTELCPCQSKKPEKYCCGVYLSGKKQPETAEKLMRSRYTAFVRSNLDYLLGTLHPSKRQPDEQENLAKSISNYQWLGLTIINTQQGKKADLTGIVEFEAVYQLAESGQLHERSRFVKSQGKWFYVDGEIFPGTIPQPTEPCWCKSGKKYRHCHELN